MNYVIYHKNCADGFGAAYAAWTKYRDDAEYIPMQYGEVKTVQDFAESQLWDYCGKFYILDFSLPQEVFQWLVETTEKHGGRVVWIDHHKTGFEAYGQGHVYPCRHVSSLPNGGVVLLDNARSGAFLAWEFFNPGVPVPYIIRRVDDYDRWAFEFEDTKAVNKAIWSYAPWTFEQWDAWYVYNNLAEEGKALLRYHNQQVAKLCAKPMRISIPTTKHPETGQETENSIVKWECPGLAVNASSSFASDVGHELAVKSGSFGAVWVLNTPTEAVVSLRSNGDYDVSVIAKSYGGGGHKNAAGFSVDVFQLLPWLQEVTD